MDRLYWGVVTILFETLIIYLTYSSFQLLVEVSLVVIALCSSILFLLLFLAENADRIPKTTFQPVVDSRTVSPEFRALIDKKLPPPIIIEGDKNG